MSDNQDNLWIGYSEEIEIFFGLENIESVKVNFVCQNENLKLLLNQ